MGHHALNCFGDEGILGHPALNVSRNVPANPVDDPKKMVFDDDGRDVLWPIDLRKSFHQNIGQTILNSNDKWN